MAVVLPAPLAPRNPNISPLSDLKGDMVGGREVAEPFCQPFSFDYNFVCHGELFLKVHKTILNSWLNGLNHNLFVAELFELLAQRINGKR